MSNKSARRSISLTPEMRERLRQIASTQPSNITEADLIREAIRVAIWMSRKISLAAAETFSAPSANESTGWKRP